MSGTENDILSNIPDFQGATDDGGAGGDTGGSSQGSSQGQDSGGGTTSAQPTQTGGAGGTSQQPAQVRRRHDGLVEVPNAANPNARDLVDPISGRTVAQGGIERKIFEDGQRATRENNQLKNELGNAKRMLSQVNEVTQEAVRLNVAPQDQVIAVRVMADFMRDPVKTLQYLVEEVKSKGYQIPFLTEGVTQGMDMSALAKLIDNKMMPFTQQHQAARQNAQIRQEAEASLNSFIDEVPEAQSNLDVIAEMLQAQPQLTLHSAHIRMVRWAQENGLDWTQSLKQQIAAMRSQQSTNQQQQPTTRPLPGGRSVSQRGTAPVNGAGAQHNENASWADIIRSSMQEHGVQFN